MNASYVCSDPKGTVVEEVGRALVQQGHYKLKILNTIDFSCSMHYNPFHYLHSETDILSLVTVIMENTQSNPLRMVRASVNTITSKGPSGHLVADDRPVVGRKVPGRAAQGTVPLTETYCEYGANHLSAVCGGFSSHPAD